jgi:hypothetical protein
VNADRRRLHAYLVLHGNVLREAQAELPPELYRELLRWAVDLLVELTAKTIDEEWRQAA